MYQILKAASHLPRGGRNESQELKRTRTPSCARRVGAAKVHSAILHQHYHRQPRSRQLIKPAGQWSSVHLRSHWWRSQSQRQCQESFALALVWSRKAFDSASRQKLHHYFQQHPPLLLKHCLGKRGKKQEFDESRRCVNFNSSINSHFFILPP